MGNPSKPNPNNREELDMDQSDARQSRAWIVVGFIAAIIILILMLSIGPFANGETPDMNVEFPPRSNQAL